MGKGTIIAHLGAGQYTVTLVKERARIIAGIAILTIRIAALETRIAALDDGKEKSLLQLQKAALELRETRLENAPEDPTVAAWCADLTEDLTGNVGTIEIPGERGAVQIQPGYDSNAVYSSARDGQLQDAIASTPAGTFYNWAMLPGWQKWMPIIRWGVLTALDTDNDLCTVTLDAAVSSAQGLNINPTDTVLTSVPIEYMECNSIAFENDDRVVVEFENQSWDSPKVIGFETEPRICATADVYVVVVFNTTQAWTYQTRYWVWNLPRNSLAHVTDAEGAAMTQPLTYAEVTAFMFRQGVSEGGFAGAFGKAFVSTEIGAWLEDEPTGELSHLCAMDGGDFYNHSTIPVALSGVTFADWGTYTRNIHNRILPSYQISFDADGGDSCFVMDYADGGGTRNYQYDTYDYDHYDFVGNYLYTEYDIEYIRSYDKYDYKNLEIQTPLGITNSFTLNQIINYETPEGEHTGLDAVYRTSNTSLTRVKYYPDLAFRKDAFLTSFIVSYCIASVWGPGYGTPFTHTSATSSGLRLWDIAIAAKYREGLDVRTMDRADIITEGRNTKLEEFVDEKLTEWLTDNDVWLVYTQGDPVDPNFAILDRWTVELKLYGAAAS